MKRGRGVTPNNPHVIRGGGGGGEGGEIMSSFTTQVAEMGEYIPHPHPQSSSSSSPHPSRYHHLDEGREKEKERRGVSVEEVVGVCMDVDDVKGGRSRSGTTSVATEKERRRKGSGGGGGGRKMTSVPRRIRSLHHLSPSHPQLKPLKSRRRQRPRQHNERDGEG